MSEFGGEAETSASHKYFDSDPHRRVCERFTSRVVTGTALRMRHQIGALTIASRYRAVLAAELVRLDDRCSVIHEESHTGLCGLPRVVEWCAASAGWAEMHMCATRRGVRPGFPSIETEVNGADRRLMTTRREVFPSAASGRSRPACAPKRPPRSSATSASRPMSARDSAFPHVARQSNALATAMLPPGARSRGSDHHRCRHPMPILILSRAAIAAPRERISVFHSSPPLLPHGPLRSLTIAA